MVSVSMGIYRLRCHSKSLTSSRVYELGGAKHPVLAVVVVYMPVIRDFGTAPETFVEIG